MGAGQEQEQEQGQAAGAVGGVLLRKAFWMGNHAAEHTSDFFIALQPSQLQRFRNVPARVSEIDPDLGVRSFTICV
jgi:hypothetical protein